MISASLAASPRHDSQRAADRLPRSAAAEESTRSGPEGRKERKGGRKARSVDDSVAQHVAAWTETTVDSGGRGRRDGSAHRLNNAM